jgi:hypothetical protein
MKNTPMFPYVGFIKGVIASEFLQPGLTFPSLLLTGWLSHTPCWLAAAKPMKEDL